MKSHYAFMLLFSLFLSCSKEKADRKINITGARFVHELENCDNSDNPEINCTQFIHFIDEDRADVLLGGEDMIFRVDYHRNDDHIHIAQGVGIGSAISFRIQN